MVFRPSTCPYACHRGGLADLILINTRRRSQMNYCVQHRWQQCSSKCVPLVLRYSLIFQVENNKETIKLGLGGSLILLCNVKSILLAKSELYLNSNCRQMTCKSICEKASSCIHYWYSIMFFSGLMLEKNMIYSVVLMSNNLLDDRVW